MRILIAEDDDVGRFQLEALLSKDGYEVVTAADGATAWQILEQHDAPPLVILDWVMPELNGLEVCRRIRESHRNGYVYVIMLTGKTRKDDIVSGMDAGADDYLSKPVHMEELRARLRAGRRILALEEALRIQATHDALTGVLNRGTIFELLQRELAKAARSAAAVGVILADLDHFKQINDRYGHPAGDAVLREAARRLKASMRAYDAVGRYGGEEFLLVLPGCALDAAIDVAQRARRAITAAPVSTGPHAVEVTASFGVATAETGRPLDLEAVIRVADEALYRAKARGRDRVESAHE
jgi:two-component system, cell cycle response regulator